MHPYFRLTETHHGTSYDDEQHGYEGPLHNVPIPANHLRGCIHFGTRLSKRGNRSVSRLVMVTTVARWDWQILKRLGWKARGSFRADSTTYRVKVLSEILARRVTFYRMNGSLVATGVDLVDGRQVLANTKVIVCSGVFHPPEILILSGIGDRTLLQHHFRFLLSLIILRSVRAFW